MLCCGIDEAGLGPTLGPMVMSACAFEVPDEHAVERLWDILANSVAPAPKRGETRLVVADSKRLYRGAKRLATLEETALSLAAAYAGDAVRDVAEFARRLGIRRLDERISSYPWYRGERSPLPLDADAQAVREKAALLEKDLHRSDVRFRYLASELLFAGEFNSIIDETGNKAEAGAFLLCELLRRLARTFEGELFTVYIDRQGGRKYYAELLARAFEGWWVEPVEEEAGHSHYRLLRRRVTVEAHFLEKADARLLPVAAASIISKYLREAFMERFNAFWKAHSSSLVPTAGYPLDAKRFIADIEGLVTALDVERDALIRKR